jgi:hypothetical protein
VKDHSFHIDEVELETMRDFIKGQYPRASVSRRAILLSNLLWQKLNPYFSHFDEHQRKTLTLELFQNTLISNRPLTAEEVNAICQQYNPLHVIMPDSPLIEVVPETPDADFAVKPYDSLGLKRYFALLLLLFLIVSGSISLVALLSPVIIPKTVQAMSFTQYNQMRHLNELPIKPIVDSSHFLDHLKYMPLNRAHARSLLMIYDSLLLEGSYLDTLENIAKSHNIHPALILSIIGQEQGFIPSTSPFRNKIINNPYNLYGSWETKQMTFEKSTEICCRLIVKLLETCPKNSNPFLWINQTYAEDERWHIGVNYFFTTLTKD